MEPNEVRISSLLPGARFDLVLSATTGRRIRGTLLATIGSAKVQLDAGQQEITSTRMNRKTGEMEEVTVKAPARIEHWCLETPVVPVEMG